MTSFFSTLNYSSCNEDPLTELKALAIGPGDRVACITGSGDRPLHMLLGDPDHVYAFDANAVQNFLLEIKMAAIRELDYEDFTKFMGLYPAGGDCRIDLLQRIRCHLSEDTRAWVDNNLKKIRRGLIYSGRWERYFKLAALSLQFWRGRKIKELFAFDDIEKQRDFLHRRWDTALWRFFLIFSFNRFFFRFIFGDPGFYSQVKKGFSPGRYIHERMNSYLEYNLAGESFMLALVFFGRFFSARHIPPYLDIMNFNILRERLGRISIHTMTLDEMLSSETASFCTKFSLSDVSSFLDRDAYDALFARIAEAPGRRFCLRDFLTNRTHPDSCPVNIHFLTDLEEQLLREDRSFGYSFIIGETA